MCARLWLQSWIGGRRLRLLLDAAKGMLYLHSRQPPVLHRDLKSANLLVDRHWQIKVADFNLSRVMQPSAAVLFFGSHKSKVCI